MLFSTLLAAAAASFLLSTGVASAPPANVEDSGLVTAPEPISVIKELARSRASGNLQVQQTNPSGCDGTSLNPTDINAAAQQWRNYCGNGRFMARGRYYYNSTSVKYYLCVYNSGGTTCSTANVNNALDNIGGRCGQYKGGWYVYPDNVAYGIRARSNNDGYCGNL